jgi:uncharacterized protein with HEPN domain
MNESRLLDYLDHIRQAAIDACSFVEGQVKENFLADRRTQQAVILSLLIIGEAATKLLQNYADFLSRHHEVPWSSMKGMRNRLAHGYFDINLEVVWETVSSALPRLLERLPAVLEDAHKIAGDGK